MSPRIFGIFLIISVLDQLYLVDGTNGMEESPPSDLNMESKCSAYYYLESTIKELKRKLDFYEHQLQIKDEHNKENVKQMETIYKLQSQLAINSKEKEMSATINDLNIRLVNAEQQVVHMTSPVVGIASAGHPRPPRILPPPRPPAMLMSSRRTGLPERERPYP